MIAACCGIKVFINSREHDCETSNVQPLGKQRVTPRVGIAAQRMTGIYSDLPHFPKYDADHSRSLIHSKEETSLSKLEK